MPNANPGEHVVRHEVFTGDCPQTSEGHFHADPSQSAIVLTCKVRTPKCDCETHFLIPRATLLAQIEAAGSRRPPGQTVADHRYAPGSAGAFDGGGGSSVPWAGWGPQGCLRLRVQHPRSSRGALVTPCASRLPLVVFESPTASRASVYVFDVNPFAARHARAAHGGNPGTGTGEGKEGATALVKDSDDFLLAVVDPECSRIPYVAYRFEPEEWLSGHRVRLVAMSMTGFTVKVSIRIRSYPCLLWSLIARLNAFCSLLGPNTRGRCRPGRSEV